MAQAYADDATFTDPVFKSLDADEARAMWKMFCERGEDLSVTYADLKADDRSGSARWEARYKFSATGRKVHNVIDATFQFDEGKILRHQDSFDLYRWTRMALGPLGAALGWTPIVQNRVRAEARAQLRRFMSA